MEYNSFYGGRRGASFIIAKSFPTVIAMVNAFKQGGNYKAVNYDEYVLIDAQNKNSADHGKLYRRGYDYNNSMGGAVYLGQITGATGAAGLDGLNGVSPEVQLDTVTNINNISPKSGEEYFHGTGKYLVSTKSLVPGKYTESGTTKYNDAISWAYCSIRDTESRETTAYIGFTFPYPVIDFTITNNTAENVKITRTDNEQHPFYEQWNINIPTPTAASGAIAGKESDPAIEAAATALPEHSVWFVVEDI